MIRLHDCPQLMPIFEAVTMVGAGWLKIPEFACREFSWTQEKLLGYLESIYKGYPVGAIFTIHLDGNSIKQFEFIKDHPAGTKTAVLKEHVFPRLVLDGYQRLQALYIAMMGSYENQVTYFKLDSGEDEKKFYLTDPRKVKDGAFVRLSMLKSKKHVKGTIEKITDDSIRNIATQNYENYLNAFHRTNGICFMPVQGVNPTESLKIFDNHHKYSILSKEIIESSVNSASKVNILN